MISPRNAPERSNHDQVLIALSIILDFLEIKSLTYNLSFIINVYFIKYAYNVKLYHFWYFIGMKMFIKKL